MSVPRVVREVRRMKQQYGMTVLLIEDDHFFHDKERAMQILEELSALDIRIEFPNGVAVYALDEDVARLFAKAGVSSVALAVESGSDYVLSQIIKKPLKTRMIRDKVRVLRDGVVIYTGKIESLRRFKDDVKEVASGYECGIGVEKYNDIKVGDNLEAFVMNEVEATL